LSNVKTYIEIKIIDKDGKVVKEVKSEANSLLWNFYRALYGLMTTYNLDYTRTTLVDISGSSFGYPTLGASNRSVFFIGAAEGEARHGIVVGTGITPVTPEDFRLASQISHGTGSGQLLYSTTDVSLGTLPDGRIALIISRTFTNSSPGDVTISEVGLGIYTNPGATARYVLIDRTVLSSPITLSPGQSAVIRYIFAE